MKCAILLLLALAACASDRPVSDRIYEALAGIQQAGDDHDAYADGAVEAGFAQKPPEMLLVLLGGHDSCAPGPQGQAMAAPFFALRRELARRGHPASFLVSCYGALSFEAYVHRSHDLGATRRLGNAELMRLVAAEARLTTGKQVVIVGHSYGGWLALQTALGLPDDLRLTSLTTIDPISQKACVRHRLGIRFVSSLLGDDADAGCQRFPDDVPAGERARLARRTLWRNYFQRQTTILRSGPAPEAATNVLVDRPHGDVCVTRAVWARVAEDVEREIARAPGAGGRAAPPLGLSGEETAFDADATAAWVEREGKAHPSAWISELSLRLFSRYAKSTFALYGRGRDHQVATYQPSLRPSLGLAVQFTPNHSFQYSRSLDVLPGGGRPKSRATQYEYEYTRRRWAFDVFYHDYRGLVRTTGGAGDARPFEDSLFHALPAAGNRPAMRLRALGAGAVWVSDPAAVSLPAMLTQKERHAGDDWSLIVDGSYRQMAVRGGGAELPDFVLHTVSVLPGLACVLTAGDWFASGTAVWGPAYRVIAGKERSAFAENGGARIAVGRNASDWFAGLAGQKRITSARAEAFEGLGLSDAYSVVELYGGWHF